MWIWCLLTKLKIKQSTPTMCCDNLNILTLSANPIIHSRTKHMELDLYFVREKVLQKKLVVNHIPSIDQVANILTKPFSSQFFERLINSLLPNNYG